MNDTAPVVIYTLADPRTNAVRYIGKTAQPHKRVSQHMAMRKITLYANTPLSRWLREMDGASVRPALTVIETTTRLVSRDRERYYIDLYQRLGCDLVNTHYVRRSPHVLWRALDIPVPMQLTIENLADQRHCTVHQVITDLLAQALPPMR